MNSEHNDNDSLYEFARKLGEQIQNKNEKIDTAFLKSKIEKYGIENIFNAVKEFINASPGPDKPCCIEHYISKMDGAHVIHVDTAGIPENSKGPKCRIYLNDDTENPIWDNTND